MSCYISRQRFQTDDNSRRCIEIIKLRRHSLLDKKTKANSIKSQDITVVKPHAFSRHNQQPNTIKIKLFQNLAKPIDCLEDESHISCQLSFVTMNQGVYLFTLTILTPSRLEFLGRRRKLTEQ